MLSKIINGVIMNMWYSRPLPVFETKDSKSIVHHFISKGHRGLAINPYQGCQHRCGYCYATYEWSPEFYDKVYAKSNAAEVLESQLKSWKSDTIEPVMVSSATDAYQPAELKYGLTKKCVEILQKYNVPYYVFTKSKIIERDLKLHQKYKEDCFLVWSITTCDEKIRRLMEPGTPPADSIFKVIKKFADAGVCCGVNIDPILPSLTDSQSHLQEIIDSCHDSGVRHVIGALLRLRSDIWERVKLILKLFHNEIGIEEYKNAIYQFKEPLKPWFNVGVNKSYETSVLQRLKEKVLEKGMTFDFPDLIRSRRLNSNKIPSTYPGGEQATLLSYM
ncbi:MAG TPA: radical SAM protein [Candidatus Nitrosopolaris sp.]|nr:radical SAM protein [Candidatus Nitrosopolaris sp.]